VSDLDEYVRPLEDLGALNLRHPYALIAFGGWIDGSWAATNALRYLVDQLSAPRVAELDPETFYNFTDTRPRVVVRGAGERSVRCDRGAGTLLAWTARPSTTWCCSLRPSRIFAGEHSRE